MLYLFFQSPNSNKLRSVLHRLENQEKKKKKKIINDNPSKHLAIIICNWTKFEMCYDNWLEHWLAFTWNTCGEFFTFSFLSYNIIIWKLIGNWLSQSKKDRVYVYNWTDSNRGKVE